MSGRHGIRERRWPGTLLIAALLGALVLGGWMLGRVTAPRPPVPPPDPYAVGLAQVLDVPDGQSAVITSPTGPRVVRIAGLSAPTGQACGADRSATFARQALRDQTVTVVPDATIPSALHLVLKTQLSYTDDALSNGMAQVADGPWWYRAVFEREQADAADNNKGLWADCWRK